MINIQNDKLKKYLLYFLQLPVLLRNNNYNTIVSKSYLLQDIFQKEKVKKTKENKIQ